MKYKIDLPYFAYGDRSTLSQKEKIVNCSQSVKVNFNMLIILIGKLIKYN